MGLKLSLQNALVLLTLQFAAFGWRINREITVGDHGRRTWFPVNDIVNVLSMVAVVIFCLVLPIAPVALGGAPSVEYLPKSARVVFAAAAVLLLFHPLAMVAHYGLLNSGGRDAFRKTPDDDYPYCPGQERIVTAASLVAAFSAAWLVAN
jgi:hypothetical protein